MNVIFTPGGRTGELGVCRGEVRVYVHKHGDGDVADMEIDTLMLIKCE